MQAQARTLVEQREAEDAAHTVTRAEREELKRRLDATAVEVKALTHRNEALVGTVEQQARELQILKHEMKNHEDRCVPPDAVHVGRLLRPLVRVLMCAVKQSALGRRRGYVARVSQPNRSPTESPTERACGSGPGVGLR